MDFKNEVHKIQEAVESLRDSENKDIIRSLLSLIEDLNDKIEEIQVNVETIQENVEFLDNDISEIQEDLFEEVSIEDLQDIDDDFKEVTCPQCNKPIFIESSAIESGVSIPCPFCGEK
ncbi:MAG: CD1247 N-terminal domain-containing protein, partial [Clostridiaceae bacterium]